MCATCGCGSAEARVAGRILSGANDIKLTDLDQRPPTVACAAPTYPIARARGGVDRRHFRGHVHSPRQPAATRMTSSLVLRRADPEAGFVAAAGD